MAHIPSSAGNGAFSKSSGLPGNGSAIPSPHPLDIHTGKEPHFLQMQTVKSQYSQRHSPTFFPISALLFFAHTFHEPSVYSFHLHRFTHGKTSLKTGQGLPDLCSAACTALPESLHRPSSTYDVCPYPLRTCQSKSPDRDSSFRLLKKLRSKERLPPYRR
jgi:hypothetical protein